MKQTIWVLRQQLWLAVIFAMVMGITAFPVTAIGDIARDDASRAEYDDAWTANDNDGFGFQAWSFVGRDNGSGSGGGFISALNGVVNIGSGLNSEAFGIYGNNGGVGAAVRPFSALSQGQTFSIDMDNQDLSTSGDPFPTVGFALQNSNNQNLFEYYLRGGDAKYTVNATDVSGITPDATLGGLRLSFTLGAAYTFTLQIDRLGYGSAVDNTITGNLLTQANQSITRVRLFNANGGPDVFFNNLVITAAVPEISPAVALPVVLAISAAFGVVWRRRTARSGLRGE